MAGAGSEFSLRAALARFLKVPVLKALAPTQSEPPFLVTQFVLLALFVALAIVAAIKSREHAGPNGLIRRSVRRSLRQPVFSSLWIGILISNFKW